MISLMLMRIFICLCQYLKPGFMEQLRLTRGERVTSIQALDIDC